MFFRDKRPCEERSGELLKEKQRESFQCQLFCRSENFHFHLRNFSLSFLLCWCQFLKPCWQIFLSRLHTNPLRVWHSLNSTGHNRNLNSSMKDLIGVACCELYISGEGGLPDSLISGKTTPFFPPFHCFHLLTAALLLMFCCLSQVWTWL